jgi:hypothetical protein
MGIVRKEGQRPAPTDVSPRRSWVLDQGYAEPRMPTSENALGTKFREIPSRSRRGWAVGARRPNHGQQRGEGGEPHMNKKKKIVLGAAFAVMSSLMVAGPVSAGHCVNPEGTRRASRTSAKTAGRTEIRWASRQAETPPAALRSAPRTEQEASKSFAPRSWSVVPPALRFVKTGELRRSLPSTRSGECMSNRHDTLCREAV